MLKFYLLTYLTHYDGDDDDGGDGRHYSSLFVTKTSSYSKRNISTVLDKQFLYFLGVLCFYDRLLLTRKNSKEDGRTKERERKRKRILSGHAE